MIYSTTEYIIYLIYILIYIYISGKLKTYVYLSSNTHALGDALGDFQLDLILPEGMQIPLIYQQTLKSKMKTDEHVLTTSIIS